MSHPVYQYLEHRYELNAISLHWEPDVLPDDAMIRELRDLLADHPARWMVWEGAPLPETVARLKEHGLESVVYDPCGGGAQQGDYLSMMQENVETVRMIFGSRQP